MKLYTTRMAGLGFAGAIFLVAGCGGSGVPDASESVQAATVAAPDAGAQPGESSSPAPAEEAEVAQADEDAKSDETPAKPLAASQPAATPPALAASSQPAASQSPKSSQPSPAKTEAPQPATVSDSKKAPGAKGNSTTTKMLAQATAPSAGPPGSSAGGAAPPAAISKPAPSQIATSNPVPASPGGPPNGAGPSKGPVVAAAKGAAPGAPSPAAGAGPAPAAGKPGTPRGPNRPNGSAAPAAPGAPGGAAQPGGPGRDKKAPDYTEPRGTVKAFLDALKAKDLDRLSESIALRAPTEASSSRNRDLFKRISDSSLSESEMDVLVDALEGYTVAMENPQRSTARADIIVRKKGKSGGYFQRKITVRREKKGWGILDVSGPMEFKSMGMIKRNTRGKRP